MSVADPGEQEFREELIGRVIGEKFCIRQCVGIGSSGAVFKADQLTLGRTVAIKVLKPELTRDPRVVRRFHDEALAASRLNHPNTVAVIDYGQTEDGLLYMVMEYLRGRTLTEVMREDGPLPADRIIDIISQVLRGLEEAHHAGVVHADLKADNIMVERRRGDWDLVKVVDFGIARLVGEADEGESKTICGTPEYMAPEIISGAAPTYASDLYAVGVVLYELLCDVTPFAGSPTMEILTKHMREAPEMPAKRRPDRSISGMLENAAMTALSKRAPDRFESASAFRRFLTGENETGPTDLMVLCGGCGVESSAKFKFCPECGRPRDSGGVQFRPKPSEAKAAAVEPETPAQPERPTIDVPEPRVEPSEGSPTHSDPRTQSMEIGALPLPLVGRQRQRDALFDFLTGSSSRNAIQIVGSPGSGKTRLIRRAAEKASRVGAITYLVDADPTGLAAPFHPVQTMLTAILGVSSIPEMDELKATIEDLELSERDLPGLADLFGFPTELAKLEVQVRRREVLTSTMRVLRAAAEKQQAVLVFEDVHLYDQPSQELLRRLTDSSQHSGIRIVVSNDEDYAGRWPFRVVRIDLQELDERALRKIANHLEGHSSRAMPSVEALRDLCESNPAHMDQLVRYVLEGGTVDAAPESVADLITARLEHLPYEASLLAQCVAVFGIEVARDLLEHTASEHLDNAEIDEALAVLCGRGVLTADDYSARFDSRLVRNVVYESTPADVRRVLHDIAAKALETADAPELLLGHHWELAENPTKAAGLLAAAGDLAVYQLDDLGACTQYQRALNAARHRLLAMPGDQSETLYVSVAIKFADAMRARGELDLSQGILDEARRYCEEGGSLLAQLERATAHLLTAQGKLDEALPHIRAAIELANFDVQLELLTDLYLDFASLLLQKDSADEAISELETGLLSLTSGTGLSATHGPANLWQLLYRMAKLHASIGSNEKAIEYGEAALVHAKRVSSNVGIARISSHLAKQYGLVGEQGKSDEHRTEAVRLMRALGDRRGTAELLLANTQPTMEMSRIDPETIREARRLAEEIDWAEGLKRSAD